MVNFISKLMSKKIVFWFCRSNFHFRFRYGNLYIFARFIKSFETIAQFVNWSTKLFCGSILIFFEIITLLCLYIAKLKQLDSRRLVVGALANTFFSVLKLRDVESVVLKINIYVSVVQELFWFFFIYWMKFAQTGSLHFDRYQIFLVSKFSKKSLSLVFW